jgi:hypothetical protein
MCEHRSARITEQQWYEWCAAAEKVLASVSTSDTDASANCPARACDQEIVGRLQRDAAHGPRVAAQPVVLEAAAVGAQLLLLGAVVHLPAVGALAA